MLNAFMIQMLNETECKEYRHLAECYWNSVDDHVEAVTEHRGDIAHPECINLARIKANQIKNLFNFESAVKEKYMVQA